MLGLQPSTTGIYGNYPSWMEIEHLAELPNLPRLLRENGYETYGAGKAVSWTYLLSFGVPGL